LFFKKKEEDKRAFTLPVPDPHDLYLPERIKEYEDHLRIDDYYCRVLVVDALPEYVHFGWFSGIVAIGGVTVSVSLSPYSPQAASDRVQKERSILGSELILAQKRDDMARFDVLNEKHEFYRQLLADINLHRNNIAAALVVIVVTARSYAELLQKCELVKDRLGATRAITLYKRQLAGFKAALPFIEMRLPEYHDVTVAGAACLAPLTSMNFSHPSGIYFGRNETGSPVFLDLFIGAPRLFGPHMFVTGTTRSGKSYACKGITARSVASGILAVILDPEGEYKKLVRTLGGAYVKIHPQMDCMFNPLDIEPEFDDNIGWFVNLPGKQDDIVFLIATMMEVQTGEKLTVEERGLAGEAVRKEYESRGVTSDPESLFLPGGIETKEGFRAGKSYKEMPTLSSYAQRLKELGAARLANVLLPYLKGGPQGYFDGQGVRRFYDSPLVCFDLSALTTEFSRMYAMYVMLSWIWEKFVKRSRETKKRVLVDEAWLFMKHKDTAQFLSQMARRGAKYKTSLMAASQSYREFTTEEGMVFLAQCDTKFFLRMQRTDAEALGRQFNLPAEVVDRIDGFIQGQGLLQAGGESAVVRFEGLPFEERFLESEETAVRV